MKRIFIALKVDPSPALLSLISTLKSVLSRDSIKWTNPENIHITLAFLGDTEENIIENISSMLKEKCAGSGNFELVIKGCGLFRSINDPRIIWTGIKPSENLLQLNETVMKGLKELMIKLEERPFKPHLTLGRIKHVNDKEILRTLTEKFENSEIQIVHVNEVILYESILMVSGPVYKPLAKYSLL
jgi:RNA 2',3'-cyclic 3'-phosphodiesterase